MGLLKKLFGPKIFTDEEIEAEREREAELAKFTESRGTVDFIHGIEDYIAEARAWKGPEDVYSWKKVWEAVAVRAAGEKKSAFELILFDNSKRIIKPEQDVDFDARDSNLVRLLDIHGKGILQPADVEETISNWLRGKRTSFAKAYQSVQADIASEAQLNFSNLKYKFTNKIADYEANKETVSQHLKEDISDPNMPNGESAGRALYKAAVANVQVTIQAAGNEQAALAFGNGTLRVASDEYKDLIEMLQRTKLVNSFGDDELSERIEACQFARGQLYEQAQDYTIRLHQAMKTVVGEEYTEAETDQSAMNSHFKRKFKAFQDYVSLALSHSEALDCRDEHGRKDVDGIIEYGSSEFQKLGARVLWIAPKNGHRKGDLVNQKLVIDYNDQYHETGITMARTLKKQVKDEYLVRSTA
tara:strand:- start:179 stop:1423 length:1245 start_codon:yes stop_codon:yes gene_type:complete